MDQTKSTTIIVAVDSFSTIICTKPLTLIDIKIWKYLVATLSSTYSSKRVFQVVIREGGFLGVMIPYSHSSTGIINSYIHCVCRLSE